MYSKHMTLILPVYNEQYKVKRLIDYYGQFGKLIVVDNFSEDNTKSALADRNVEIVSWKNEGTIQTPEFMSFVRTIVDTKYVLLLSSSEFVPRPLIALFAETAKSGKHGMIRNLFKSYTCGERNPFWGSKYRLKQRIAERFFNLDELLIEKVLIHKPFEISDPTRILSAPANEDYTISHLRDVDTYSLLTKYLGYARVQASQMTGIGKNYSFARLVLMTIREQIRFLRLPIKYWNFVSLREMAAFMVMHLAVYLIAYEIKHDRSLDYSRQKTDELWDELVKEQ